MADNNAPYLVGERGPEVIIPESSGTVIPSGASGRMYGMPTIPGLMNKAQGDFNTANRKIEGYQNQIAQETKAKQLAQAPVREEIMGKLAAPPKVGEMKEMPTAPKTPHFDEKEMGDALGMITVLAALGGALTRQPLTAALNSFSAGVNGLVQGKQNDFQNSLKSFDANLKTAQQENEAVWKKYQAAKDEYGTDIQGLNQKLELIAAEHQDNIGLLLAQKGDTASLFQRQEKQNELFVRLEEHRERLKAMAQKAAGGAGEGFTPEETAFWTKVLQKGGTLPLGLARSPGGKKLTADTMKGVAHGDVTPESMLANQAEFGGMKAGERTLGNRQAQIEMAGQVLTQFIPLAKAASAEYERSGIKSVNDLQNATMSRTASPELRRLNASVNAVINAYGRAINPSGVGNEADKAEARKILDAAFSTGDFDAAIDQLGMEIGAEMKAPGRVKEGMRDYFTGEGHKKGGTPTISSDAEYDALPSGTVFIAPNGKTKRKP